MTYQPKLLRKRCCWKSSAKCRGSRADSTSRTPASTQLKLRRGWRKSLRWPFPAAGPWLRPLASTQSEWPCRAAGSRGTLHVSERWLTGGLVSAGQVCKHKHYRSFLICWSRLVTSSSLFMTSLDGPIIMNLALKVLFKRKLEPRRWIVLFSASQILETLGLLGSWWLVKESHSQDEEARTLIHSFWSSSQKTYLSKTLEEDKQWVRKSPYRSRRICTGSTKWLTCHREQHSPRVKQADLGLVCLLGAESVESLTPISWNSQRRPHVPGCFDCRPHDHRESPSHDQQTACGGEHVGVLAHPGVVGLRHRRHADDQEDFHAVPDEEPEGQPPEQSGAHFAQHFALGFLDIHSYPKGERLTYRLVIHTSKVRAANRIGTTAKLTRFTAVLELSRSSRLRYGLFWSSPIQSLKYDTKSRFLISESWARRRRSRVRPKGRPLDYGHRTRAEEAAGTTEWRSWSWKCFGEMTYLASSLKCSIAIQ